MVTEMRNDLPCKPDAIFCSVGGGGLLGGIIIGCKNVGWEDGKCTIFGVRWPEIESILHSVSPDYCVGNRRT